MLARHVPIGPSAIRRRQTRRRGCLGGVLPPVVARAVGSADRPGFRARSTMTRPRDTGPGSADISASLTRDAVVRAVSTDRSASQTRDGGDRPGSRGSLPNIGLFVSGMNRCVEVPDLSASAAPTGADCHRSPELGAIPHLQVHRPCRSRARACTSCVWAVTTGAERHPGGPSGADLHMEVQRFGTGSGPCRASRRRAW
jgi:hypothetical protein